MMTDQMTTQAFRHALIEQDSFHESVANAAVFASSSAALAIS